jgi:DNA adenine methylase
MALWAEIINAPEALADAYTQLWFAQGKRERAFYDEVRNRFNQEPQPVDFLYLLARCVKASVRYNANGEFNQSPDNRRKGARPSTMRQHIIGASQLLRGKTDLSSDDYEKVLQKADAEDLVYMDPPYQGVCGNRDPRYAESVSFDRFVEALREANDRQLSYIVSYDGRTGSKEYGRPMPDSLRLHHIEIDAGRSSQATLCGRDATTIESLYFSPALMDRIGYQFASSRKQTAAQLSLLETSCQETTTPLSSSSV